ARSAGSACRRPSPSRESSSRSPSDSSPAWCRRGTARAPTSSRRSGGSSEVGMAVPLSYNVRNLFVRRWTSAFTAGGIALVVAATMLLAALVGGLQQILVTAGEPDNLVVLRKGATNDGSSQVPRDAAQAVRSLSGIAVGADGLPLFSPEIVNQPFMHNPDGGRENVLVRGVEP